MNLQGGPSPEWLLLLWRLLLEWTLTLPSVTALLDPLAGWALIPSCNGDVVRIAFRHIVVTPPSETAPRRLLLPSGYSSPAQNDPQGKMIPREK